MCLQRPGYSHLEPNRRHWAFGDTDQGRCPFLKPFSLAAVSGEDLKKSRKFYVVRILKSYAYQVGFRR